MRQKSSNKLATSLRVTSSEKITINYVKPINFGPAARTNCQNFTEFRDFKIKKKSKKAGKK